MGKKIQCIGRYKMDGIVLGKGNFAYVELATHGVTKVKVAIKIIDTRKIKDEYVRTNLHREARIMAALHHPNIVRLYETLKATTLYCLVTEFASGGELLSYIKTQKECRLQEGAARPFIRQLVSTIHYLHERNIVHRDLKMENIMLDEKQKNIKLIDFGLSNICKDDRLKTHCGSPEYAAPELFVVGRTYGPEIDIWSLGIITFAMVLGRLPFFTPHHDEYHRQRMLQQIQKGLSAIHDRQMQTLSADCRNLLHQLIEPNPELRIPLPEIELHPWLTKNGKHPFAAYIAPPRNKSLRIQIVAELAELMDMKKGVVNETVKENRADELSAMFNMLMDQRRKELGLMDYDHNRRLLHAASSSGAHASGDGAKSQGPDGSRLRTPVTRSAQPFRKRDTAPRPRSDSARPKKRSQSIGSGPLSPNSVPKEGGSRASRSDRSRSGAAPNLASPSPCSIHDPSKERTTLLPPGSLSQPSNVPTQPNGPSRIPVMPITRPRAAKLSLTLDLSVVNPGEGVHRSQAEQDQLLARRREAISDCSYGIAASSGVPPQMSPNVQSKEPGAKSGGSDPVKGKLQSKPRASITQRKARRPSSLQYSLKLNPPKLKAYAESPPGQPTAVEANTAENLVAPKATPEDSLIDSCSSSISEEPCTAIGFFEERPTPTDKTVGDSQSRIEHCFCASFRGISNTQSVIETVKPHSGPGETLVGRQSGAQVPNLAPLERFTGLTGSPSEARGGTSSKLNPGQCLSDAKKSTIPDLAGQGNCSLESKYQQFSISGSQRDSSRDNWRPVIRSSDKELSSSDYSTTTDQKLRCGSIGYAHDLNQWSCITLCQAGQPSETDTPVAEGQGPGSAKRSVVVSISDESNGRLSGNLRGHSAAAVLRSPESPPWAQSRFSRIGSHALDVFFSPEEVGPMEPLWRPVATTLKGSPTELGSSSSDQFEGEVGSCAEFPPCRIEAVSSSSSHLTSLDGLYLQDDETDCTNTNRRSVPSDKPRPNTDLCPSAVSLSSSPSQTLRSQRRTETKKFPTDTVCRKNDPGECSSSAFQQQQASSSRRDESLSIMGVKQSDIHNSEVTFMDGGSEKVLITYSTDQTENPRLDNQEDIRSQTDYETNSSATNSCEENHTRDCPTGNLKSGGCSRGQKKVSPTRHRGEHRLRWYDQSYPTHSKDLGDRKQYFSEDNRKSSEDNRKSSEDNRKSSEDNRKSTEDNRKSSSRIKPTNHGSSNEEALRQSFSGVEISDHTGEHEAAGPLVHRRSRSEVPSSSSALSPDHRSEECEPGDLGELRPSTADLPLTSEKSECEGRSSKEPEATVEPAEDVRSVGMTTRRRIPVLRSLLKDRRTKRDQCDGQVAMAMSAMATTATATDTGQPESGTRVRSSGSSRLPTWRQGLSRLFQISRTTPAASDRNANDIGHSVVATPFSGSSFKSKLRLAAQSNQTSSSCEAVHAKTHLRRKNDGGDTSTEHSVPPADKMGTDAAPPSKVHTTQSPRKVEGRVSFDDAHFYTANRDERAGPDLTRANSVRSNHCRTNDAGDNNGNTAVPRVDWAGIEKTSGVHQETSYHQTHLSGSLKVCRTSSSSKRNSSRLKARRLNWSSDCDKRPESDTSALSDNTHLRKVLPASYRSTVVDSVLDAETGKT